VVLMDSLYRFDEFVLDPVAFTLTRSGRTVPLEPKVFDLLRYLVEHPNRIVTKRELLDTIWKDVAVTDNVLGRAIVLVRKALGDDARVAKYVQTVPTRGYRFVAQPARTSDAERELISACGHDGANPEPSPVTVAVLPFVNLSDDSGTEHFSDGISEDILNALAHAQRPPRCSPLIELRVQRWRGRCADHRRTAASGVRARWERPARC
jgi:DNA-binding winged helix-turn-helix (wHTH) protein